MSKKLLKKIQAIVLALALVCMLMPAMSLRVQAASFTFDNCISDTELYSSGCLKSMKVKIIPSGDYATAYGKIAIHSKKVQYNYQNPYLDSSQANWNNVDNDFLKTNDGLVAWSAGSEFCWTNWNSGTSDGSNIVTVNFNDGEINLNTSATFYIYLWTRSDNYGIYTDGLIGSLNAGNGQLKVGDTVVASSSSVDKSALTTAISEATAYYNSIQATYADIASTLNTAIATAQAVADNSSATAQEVADAVTALNTAKSTAESAVSTATTSNTTTTADYSFSNCYDCQRSPSYPKKGQNCAASSFTNPLIGYQQRGSTTAGNWTLTYIGLFKDNTSASSHIAEVASSVQSSYNLSSSDNVPIYELKDGDTHIAYGTLCGLSENNSKALFIGDNWFGGAGYVLSTEALSGSYTFSITTDINDIIANKTGGGTTTTVDKTALNEAITSATTYQDTIKDEYADIATTLGEAIAAAEAVFSNDAATADEVTAAITTLNTAVTTAKEAVANASSTSQEEKKIAYEEVAPTAGTVTDITNETSKATGETNPFSTSITNSSELEKLIGVTAAEKAQGVNVWLDIEDASATVSEADKTIITNVSGGFTLGQYIDVSLFKKVGNNAEEKVTETNGLVQFSFVIPENLRKAGRTYALGKVHNGVGSVLQGTLDATAYTFTVSTSEFSSYAILYSDPVVTAASATPAATPSATPAAPAAPAVTPAPAASPKTGETFPLVLVLLMVLSVTVGGSAIFVRRK